MIHVLIIAVSDRSSKTVCLVGPADAQIAHVYQEFAVVRGVPQDRDRLLDLVGAPPDARHQAYWQHRAYRHILACNRAVIDIVAEAGGETGGLTGHATTVELFLAWLLVQPGWRLATPDEAHVATIDMRQSA